MALTDNLTASSDPFIRRHIGPNPDDAREMLAQVGFKNLDELIDAAVPKTPKPRCNIRKARLWKSV